MPEAFSTRNLVALPITSQELGRGGGGFAPPPTKIVLSNSPTTIGLTVLPRDEIFWQETSAFYIKRFVV